MLKVTLTEGTMKDKKYRDQFTAGKEYEVIGNPIIGRAPEPQLVLVSDIGRMVIIDSQQCLVVMEKPVQPVRLTESVKSATSETIAKLEAGIGKGSKGVV